MANDMTDDVTDDMTDGVTDDVTNDMTDGVTDDVTEVTDDIALSYTICTRPVHSVRVTSSSSGNNNTYKPCYLMAQ